MSFADYGIIINETGVEVRATCPKCSPMRKKSRDKCLSVNTVEGVWNCFHCGWTGCLKGGDYKPIKYERSSLPEKVVKYFADRGISESYLEAENIGFEVQNGVGWIKFPYYQRSVVVNIKYRSGAKGFKQATGGKSVLYRYDDIAGSREKTLVITEGEIDCLSCLVAGFESTSIPNGAPTANTKNYRTKFDFLNGTSELFEKFDKVVIAGDSDEPGETAIVELGRRIGVEKCYIAKYPADCKDPNDVLVHYGKDELKSRIENAQPFPVEGLIVPSSLKERVMREYISGVKGGASTGWKPLDEFYTVRPGEMTIVTGIPGSGKSNFVDALCVNLIMDQDWSFGFFSPENWPCERHTQTILAKILRKSFDETGYGPRMQPNEILEMLPSLDRYVKFIVPKNELLTIDTILKFARILVLQHGIKGLVIDPWNEVEHHLGSLREDQYISQELTKIRRFARFNGIHIWVVAHPTKLQKNSEGQYDPPTMYDISGGAHWRNKADNGICVYRDFETNETEIIVQKIRFREIGRLGSTGLRYTYYGGYTA